jgi:hypothetical protein
VVIHAVPRTTAIIVSGAWSAMRSDQGARNDERRTKASRAREPSSRQAKGSTRPIVDACTCSCVVQRWLLWARRSWLVT